MKKILVLLLSVLLAAALFGCGKELPPDNGTNQPPALNGLYLCRGLGYLSFNGDGQTIEMKITEPFENTGLPEGINEGTYVFLFGNEKWRYDLAETLKITVDGKSYKVSSVPGETDETKITLLLENGDSVLFERQ